MTTVSETLYKAADHVERFGHHKGDGFADPNHCSTSPACIIGAINAATKFELTVPGRLDVYESLRMYLGGRGAVDFNDDPNTTQADVVAALKAAALIEQARETEAGAAAIIAGALAQPVTVVSL